MGKLTSIILAAVLVLVLVTSAPAAMLGLTVGSPDVVSQAVNITYTTSGLNGILSASGTPITKNPGSVAIGTAKSFSLTLNITHGTLATSPVTVTSGTLTLTGNLGSGSTSLFNYSGATAPQFGFSTSSNTPSFDILFPSGTGSLDAGNGSIGVILAAGSSVTNYTTNLFTQNFANSAYAGNADTFTPPAVPEPASLTLVGLGGGALLLRRRRR